MISSPQNFARTIDIRELINKKGKIFHDICVSENINQNVTIKCRVCSQKITCLLTIPLLTRELQNMIAKALLDAVVGFCAEIIVNSSRVGILSV